MRDENDAGTGDLFGSDVPKKRGRPPKGSQAQTPAERMRTYRQRQQLQKAIAAGDLKAASTATLLALLNDYVPAMDRPGVDEVERQACQIVSRSILEELLQRTRTPAGGSDETTKSR